MAIGILSDCDMRHLCEEALPQRISTVSGDDPRRFVHESSLDLPLGAKYWEMKGSCRTGRIMKVDPDLIGRFSKSTKPLTLKEDLVLKKRSVYLFESDLRLNLTDKKILGKATARSSIGRLDVFVRLLCDRAEEFDRLPSENEGFLYVEVTPITFDLIVRSGTCLSQLRLFEGTDRLVSITREESEYERDFPVVGDGAGFGTKYPYEELYPFRLDLAPDPRAKCAGFVAKIDAPEAIDPDKRGHYDPRQFWEAVPAEDGAIALEPDRLYLLRSKEHLRLPGHIALECQAYTETMGEWRIEYAGFAHPWFGSTRPQGSPLIFEIRGHNIPTILTDGIPLGNVSFKRMASPATKPSKPGQYEDQELRLSGCFRDWPTESS